MPFFRRRSKLVSPYADPDKLQELIRNGEGHHLVDVRTVEEYVAGHIPTARLIPHPEIIDRPPTADKEQLIILYCQSGARSGQARKGLVARGYQNVVDFGSINRWPGSLEYGQPEADS
jgi:phage shock protein E